MLIAVYIFCLVFGLGIGYLIRQAVNPQCKHNWVLFKNATINTFRNGQEVQVGYVKFYECEHCKKMKKEKIELN
jgi:hypothetical protein